MLACSVKMVGGIGWSCGDSLGGSTNDGMAPGAGILDSAPILRLEFGTDTDESL